MSTHPWKTVPDGEPPRPRLDELEHRLWNCKRARFGSMAVAIEDMDDLIKAVWLLNDWFCADDLDEGAHRARVEDVLERLR